MVQGFSLRYVLKIAVLGTVCVVIGACSKSDERVSNAAVEPASTPVHEEASAVIRTDRIPAPPLPSVATTGSTSNTQLENTIDSPTTGVVQTADSSTTNADKPVDVGYEGLAQSINRLENTFAPYRNDKTMRLSPEVANQLDRQSQTYFSEVKHAASVDKEVRGEIRDMVIDIHAAVGEMKDLPPGERYENLRSLTSRRIEEIQAILTQRKPSL